MLQAIKNVLVHARTEGWCTTARKFRSARPSGVFEVWRLTGVELACPLSNPAWRVLVGEAALRELVSLRKGQLALPFDFYRDQADGARTCAVLLADGVLAGVVWAYDERQKSHFLRLGDGAAEIRGLYCLPAYRGRGVGTVMTRQLCRFMAVQGQTEVYATIHGRNFSSLKVFRNSGFEKVAQLKRAALFGPRYSTAEGRVDPGYRGVWSLFGGGGGPAPAHADPGSDGIQSARQLQKQPHR